MYDTEAAFSRNPQACSIARSAVRRHRIWFAIAQRQQEGSATPLECAKIGEARVEKPFYGMRPDLGENFVFVEDNGEEERV